MKTDDVNDRIDEQLRAQGVSVIAVTDGHVFTFTAEVLRLLQEQAAETGRVVLFVQRGVMQ